MKFKLIVFDWDGTLMDSEARIVDCMHLAIRDVGQPPKTSEQIRNIIGLGLLEAVRALLPEASEAVHLQVKESYRAYYLTDQGIPSPLFPGADQVVRDLLDDDYLLAVATGKGRSGLDKAMRETGMAALFHSTRCADETFSKPHPQMLEQIMDELGVFPAETLMIGDTEYDMQLAANARAASLAVDYGVHSRERLMAQSPLGCLSDVRELPGWLERNPAAGTVG
jgi:phosphoglycolate phosphatase